MSQTADRLHDFVRGLEKSDRYIVMMYYADGLTPIEIGMVLEMPTTEVATRLDGLRAKLGRVLEANAPTGGLRLAVG
ncbi:MAG: hypothetical protein AAF797_13225 [Planctomycetota bacterium]